MSAQSMMSKRRYNAIKDAIEEVYGGDKLDTILSKICDIMNFDPTANTYDKVKEKMTRQKEESGLSTYQALNRKQYYEKNKNTLNLKRTEARRKNT